MNGTWTRDASGIQCALDAIGSTGFAGIGAADLREDPDEVHGEAVARRQLPGDVHVVEGIRVGRVREPGGDAPAAPRARRRYRVTGIRTAGAA